MDEKSGFPEREVSYTTIDEQYGYRLVQLVGTDRFTVVRVDHNLHRVYSAMPGDGDLSYKATDRGIDFVSQLYTYTYARHVFFQLTSSQAAWEAELDAP